MRLIAFLFIVCFISGPVFADQSMDGYAPPDMFGGDLPERFSETPQDHVIREASPPLPTRRPERFFASRAYLQKLYEQQASRHKVVDLNARDVLKSIED